MIESFACKHTRQLFEGRDCPKAFRAFQRQAERKLQLLDSAATLDFLRSPPGNRLEALQGDRQGQYSIRINGQWRLCFRFEHGGAFDVEIVDYH
ncbi:type II toxin-antitoxin system RelE/ParE family toxin [Halomonas salipaludis]|uniref:Excinuclease ABC subunit A n=1 Tax=Halomonas salipaludis TaxID=2032625 RepID=A0A2A2EZ15_9GAMM|nr:type II toxin-antitoxin system RelE/ParE family toxin [Halomonas salipaludis]PAU77592.1 excinuclease ABC subunit A [Halomonas salipaludis]